MRYLSWSTHRGFYLFSAKMRFISDKISNEFGISLVLGVCTELCRSNLIIVGTGPVIFLYKWSSCKILWIFWKTTYSKKFVNNGYYKFNNNSMLTLINFERYNGVEVGCIGDSREILSVGNEDRFYAVPLPEKHCIYHGRPTNYKFYLKHSLIRCIFNKVENHFFFHSLLRQ